MFPDSDSEMARGDTLLSFLAEALSMGPGLVLVRDAYRCEIPGKVSTIYNIIIPHTNQEHANLELLAIITIETRIYFERRQGQLVWQSIPHFSGISKKGNQSDTQLFQATVWWKMKRSFNRKGTASFKARLNPRICTESSQFCIL